MSVAVIVPVHGEAPWLSEALDGVLGQEPPPAEVIVVDDGSPEPVRLPDEHGARCRLIRLDARSGPAAAREAALAETAAELIALADADDVWEQGKLALQVAALERHPQAALCFGGVSVVGADGRPTGERWEALPEGLLAAEELGPRLYVFSPISASSVLLRRDALVEVDGFAGPARLGSDWDLWLRLVEAGHAFVHEPRARVRYRRHPGGVTHDIAGVAEANLAIRAAHAGLSDPETRRTLRHEDLIGLARGRIRERRYADARRHLSEAEEIMPLAPRERALRTLAAVPGLRAALGRRDPYR